MGQSTILAAGTTAATSSDVTVAAGSVVTVGIFASTGQPNVMGPVCTVFEDTPGGDVGVAILSADNPSTVLTGPGTFRVVRSPVAEAIGVFSET